jgi:hypothetical protein
MGRHNMNDPLALRQGRADKRKGLAYTGRTGARPPRRILPSPRDQPPTAPLDTRLQTGLEY